MTTQLIGRWKEEEMANKAQANGSRKTMLNIKNQRNEYRELFLLVTPIPYKLQNPDSSSLQHAVLLTEVQPNLEVPPSAKTESFRPLTRIHSCYIMHPENTHGYTYLCTNRMGCWAATIRRSRMSYLMSTQD